MGYSIANTKSGEDAKLYARGVGNFRADSGSELNSARDATLDSNILVIMSSNYTPVSRTPNSTFHLLPSGPGSDDLAAVNAALDNAAHSDIPPGSGGVHISGTAATPLQIPGAVPLKHKRIHEGLLKEGSEGAGFFGARSPA